jgi:hypothetical protein
MADDIKEECSSDSGGIFYVEFVAAERSIEGHRLFLCKWKGYPWAEYAKSQNTAISC